jgi:hypothetical protein
VIHYIYATKGMKKTIVFNICRALFLLFSMFAKIYLSIFFLFLTSCFITDKSISFNLFEYFLLKIFGSYK